LLFFWATWCPPCQKPMAHNFKIRERNAENWKNVRIIAISTDENPS
jgi:thiol-disulfide isomerase/thioredoxin